MGYVWLATFIAEFILSFYLGFTCNFTMLGVSLTLFFLALLYSTCFGYLKPHLDWGNFIEQRLNVIGMPMFFAIMFAVCGASTRQSVNEYKIISAEYIASQLEFKEKKHEHISKWVEYRGMSFDYRQLPNGNYKLTRRLK